MGLINCNQLISVIGLSNSHDSCDGEDEDCEPTHDCDELQGRVPAIKY